MKLLITLFMICCCCIAAEASLDKKKLLNAIAEVETGNDYTKIGSSGERSEWQFTKQTWEQYTSVAHEVASMKVGRATAWTVAEAHFNWIVKYLKDRNHPVTAYNVALIWNGGVGNFQKNELQDRHRDYAKRVSNLYGVKILLAEKK